MDRDLVKLVTSSVIQFERKVVPIIPFSQLTLDTTGFFSGGTARVYKGYYHEQQVFLLLRRLLHAIAVLIYPHDVTRWQ
eukprot:scaffold865_cov160-Ochromonas_danica.AAC.18